MALKKTEFSEGNLSRDPSRIKSLKSFQQHTSAGQVKWKVCHLIPVPPPSKEEDDES